MTPVSEISTTSSTTLDSVGKQALISYIISHAEGDQRPYLEVSILGHKILGLLDSGSSVTLVGKEGYKILENLGLPLDDRHQIKCTVANGQICASAGIVKTPVSLMDKVCVLDIVVLPNLSNKLILGTDFWLLMDVVPNLKRNVWHFGEDSVAEVCGIQDENTLNEDQRTKLNTLLEEKFKKMGSGLGFTTVASHDIILEENAAPRKQRYYPVSPFKQQILDEEIKKMLELDVIEPSKSPWSSPVLLVPKEDKTYRFCVDYRALNSVTKKDAYPIPFISSILDKLRGARYLSSMDIKSAYWQVPVKPECREFTAFTIPSRGLYQFKRMPFGLSNAPATWQRLIDRVLGADLEPYVLVYLDDIIIISPDFDTHLQIISKVFDRLIAAGLTLGPDKCKFCRPSLKYLGYVVDANGLHVDVEKVEAIIKIQRPKTPTEIRRFLGMTGWYRKFVPNFSTLVAPLTKLTHKNVPYVWTEDCEKSFNHIKNSLISAPILTCPDFTKPFVLQTDASAYGLGAVLTQQFDEDEKVICFLSRSLTKQERNYSTTERECLSVIWSVEKLRHYLEGIHFTIITDHASLIWLNRLKNPTGRLARWALRLQPFDYTIIHRKGKDHVVPDFLSRNVDSITVTPKTIEDFANTSDIWYKKMITNIGNRPDKFPQWRVDGDTIYKYVKCTIPELSTESDYWKIVVPKDKRREIISQHHDDVRAGHVGIYKTYWKLYTRFTWPKMRADVAKYIKACQICAQNKPEQKPAAGLMGSRPPIDKPWQMISLDFMGPYPRSSNGYCYLLSICDYFSKYVVLCPLRTATSKALTRFVEEQIFCVYGVPQFLICDNGKQMRSKEFQNLCNKYHTKISYTAHYNARADPVERYNKIIKTMISCYLKDNHKRWDENIAAIGCAIRTSKSETTGFTPYFLNFGREYIGDGNEYKYLLQSQNEDKDMEGEMTRRKVGYQMMFEKVKNRILSAQERNRKVYNLRRRPVHFKVGDRVWRKNKILSDASKNINAKLSPKFIGPFTVSRKIGNWTYDLIDSAGKSTGIWHVQDLKPSFEHTEE